MSYGFKAINDTNITVIDQDFSNYCLHSTVNISTGVDDPFWFDQADSLWYDLYIPNIQGVLVFSDCPYYLSVRNGVGNPGSTITLVFNRPYDANYVPIPNWNFNIYFFIPSSSMPIPSATYGLNVRKSNGELAFSSDYIYPKHLQTFVIPSTDSFSLDIPISNKTPGRKLIFCINPFHLQGAYWYWPEGGLRYDGELYITAAIANNSSFVAGADIWWAFNAVSSAYNGSASAWWTTNEHIYVGEI